MIREVRTISVSVAGSSSTKVATTFEKDLHVVGVMATERGGTSLHNVHLTFSIDGTPIIRPSIPASQLGINREQSLDLDFTVRAGSTFEVSITNNLTTAVIVDISLLIG